MRHPVSARSPPVRVQRVDSRPERASLGGEHLPQPFGRFATLRRFAVKEFEVKRVIKAAGDKITTTPVQR